MSQAASRANAEPELLRSDDAGARTLTLNRPAQRNALTSALLDALDRALDDADRDPDVRVVVIAASGSAFCAGHDLAELRAHREREWHLELFSRCSAVMQKIVQLAKPVIARVQGVATAAGCQLVATCDLAVAARSARFATPGVNIGLFCSTPMVALSRAVGRKQAMQMLLTGELLDAEQAAQAGLINSCVDDEQLDATVGQLVKTICAKSPLTLAIGKQAFYRQLELGLSQAYAYTAEVMAQNMMTQDASEGIEAFLARREPRWRGR